MAAATHAKVLPCIGCKDHPFQDKRYGKGMRVMSSTAKENVYRCGVCSKERNG